MSYALIRIKFQDYAKWRAVFDEASSFRKTYTSKGVRIFRPVDKPDEAVILGEYGDLEKARQLFQSAEYRTAIQNAGVVEMPEVSFLDEVGQLSA